MKKEKELLVAVASQKGGVGKSVFTVLLASVLHYRKGLRVAVVDCDSPQHSIVLMRERDMEGVMKNDDLKVNLYRQYERIRKPAYPVIKSDPEKAVEDLRRYMDEKGETFDIVLFDLPGTLRSEGVVHTVSAMDYIFVPLKADNIVMQSSLQFAKVLEEELIAKGNCNLKGIRLFWNMVDRRGRKDLYDAWNRVIHRMGLRLLSSHPEHPPLQQGGGSCLHGCLPLHAVPARSPSGERLRPSGTGGGDMPRHRSGGIRHRPVADDRIQTP